MAINLSLVDRLYYSIVDEVIGDVREDSPEWGMVEEARRERVEKEKQLYGYSYTEEVLDEV